MYAHLQLRSKAAAAVPVPAHRQWPQVRMKLLARKQGAFSRRLLTRWVQGASAAHIQCGSVFLL